MTTVTITKGDKKATWDDGDLYGDPDLVRRLLLTSRIYLNRKVPLTPFGPYAYPSLTNPHAAAACAMLAGAEWSGELEGMDGCLPVPQVAKHGQGSHDDEDHGNWADGILPRIAPYTGGRDSKGQRIRTFLGTEGVVDVADITSEEILNHPEKFPGMSTSYLPGEFVTALPTVDKNGKAKGGGQSAQLAAWGFTPLELRQNLVDLATENAATYDWMNSDHSWYDDEQLPHWLQTGTYSIHTDQLVERQDGKWRFREGAGDMLRDIDTFYERWHDDLTRLSVKTDISLDRLVAAAAAVSPGQDARANLGFAHEMAWLVSQNANKGYHISSEDSAGIQAYLLEQAEKYKGYAEDAKTETNRLAKLKMSQEYALAAEVDYTGTYFNELDIGFDGEYVTNSRVRAQVGAFIRSQEAQRWLADQGSPTWLSRDHDGLMGGKKGFSTKNWANFEKAFAVLNGEMTPDEVLGDVKVRSFFNNIVDPLNTSGADDVTVDFQSMDFTFASTGTDGITTFLSGPDVNGVSLGLRPMVADLLRSVTFNPDGSLTDLARSLHVSNSAQMQEKLWGAHKRRTVADRAFRDGKPLDAWATNVLGLSQPVPILGDIWHGESQAKNPKRKVGPGNKKSNPDWFVERRQSLFTNPDELIPLVEENNRQWQQIQALLPTR